MPRPMPDLAGAFERAAREASQLAAAAEAVRVALASSHRSLLSTYRIVLLYELAYLRLFIAWEEFLEESFIRYMCGYSAGHGTEVPTAGYRSTLNDARSHLLSGRSYLLWHDPDRVIRRSQDHFQNGRHEIVLSSVTGRAKRFAAIRHRIAHAQAHAREQFDQATMLLSGRRYVAGRPGRFLRDWTPGAATPTRWLDTVGNELISLAYQITP